MGLASILAMSFFFFVLVLTCIAGWFCFYIFAAEREKIMKQSLMVNGLDIYTVKSRTLWYGKGVSDFNGKATFGFMQYLKCMQSRMAMDTGIFKSKQKNHLNQQIIKQPKKFTTLKEKITILNFMLKKLLSCRGKEIEYITLQGNHHQFGQFHLMPFIRQILWSRPETLTDIAYYSILNFDPWQISTCMRKWQWPEIWS